MIDKRTSKDIAAEWEEVKAQFATSVSGNPPTAEQIAISKDLQAKVLEFAELLVLAVPASRERSLSLTKAQEALMWANKANFK